MSVITQLKLYFSLTVAPSEPFFFPKIPPSLTLWKFLRHCPEDGVKIHLFTAQRWLPSLEKALGMIVEMMWLWDPAERSQQDSSLWKRGCSSLSHLSPKRNPLGNPMETSPPFPPPVAFSIFHFGKQESKSSSQIAVYSKGKALQAGSPPEALSEQSPCKQGWVNSASRQVFVFSTNGNYVP